MAMDRCPDSCFKHALRHWAESCTLSILTTCKPYCWLMNPTRQPSTWKSCDSGSKAGPAMRRSSDNLVTVNRRARYVVRYCQSI